MGTSSTNTDYSTSQIRRWLNNEFLPTLYDANNLLVDSTWDYTTYTEATTTKVKPTAYVENEKVGLLTIYDYYKVGTDSSSFLNNGYFWWTMTPQADGASVYAITHEGNASNPNPTDSNSIRPSVNLRATIQIARGDGTKTNPYVIEGDKATGTASELLNDRVSGEYINFNDVLYRIVGIEEVNGVQLTKVTMADYNINRNTLTTSLAFGASTNELTYSSTYGIGLYLEEWYQADSTSEKYATTYINDAYKAMIATKNEGVIWYAAQASGVGVNYTLSKTGTGVSATIGLGYYGEMFSSQFGGGHDLSNSFWLMTKYDGLEVWRSNAIADVYHASPSYSYGVRPSFYLKSDVKITGGSGMPHDPYEITR